MSTPLEDYNFDTYQIAKVLGYHPQYVRFLASSGKIPCIKRGRAWMFSETEILNYLKLKTEEATNAPRPATDGGSEVR